MKLMKNIKYIIFVIIFSEREKEKERERERERERQTDLFYEKHIFPNEIAFFSGENRCLRQPGAT